MRKSSLIGLLFLIFTISSCSIEEKEAVKPNIIIVLADDLGIGDIGAFNPEGKIKTPNLDMMAAEGMIFTDAHTSSSVCTPTRYGLLTGRYNWRTRLKRGVLNGKSDALIPNTRTTIGSLLQSQGYYTAFIGKWHLGWQWAFKEGQTMHGENFENVDFTKPIKNSPMSLGFDYTYGHIASLDMPPYVYVENEMPTQVPDTITENKSKYGWWRKGPTSPDFTHEDVTPNFFRRAYQYIEERAGNEEPFFLYLPLPSPHTPILPTEEWQGKSGMNPYADFMMMIDDYMGQLNQVIKDQGIEENTLIIFTSDNGCSPQADFEELEEKGHYPSYIYRGHKADIFEGGHRVPFIVKWPKAIKEGTVSDEIICTTDLLATCAEISGYDLKDNEGEDSYSLLPVLKQENMNKPLREATIHHSIKGDFAIRKGDWKFITCPGSGGWSYPRPGRDDAVIDSLPPFQLYNLKEDPAESNNLIESNPEKAEELKQLLAKIIIDGRSTIGEPQKNDSINSEWNQIRFMNQ